MSDRQEVVVFKLSDTQFCMITIIYNATIATIFIEKKLNGRRKRKQGGGERMLKCSERRGGG